MQKTIFLSLIFLSQLVFAHGNHDHKHESEIHTVKDFANLAHHELEPPRGKWQAWLAAINPYKTLLRAKRFYNRRSVDPQFNQHAKNLALLLPLSEALEVSTGPYVAHYTATHEFPWLVEGLMNLVGWGISVPFVVEPYCLAVIGTYAAVGPVQTGLSKLRLWLTQGVKRSCEVTGARSFMDRHFPLIDTVDALTEAGWLFNGNEQHLIAVRALDDDRGIVLRLGHHEGIFVSGIEVIGLSRKELKAELAPLNWSARALLLEDFKNQDYQKTYKTREILVRPKRSICSTLLTT